VAQGVSADVPPAEPVARRVLDALDVPAVLLDLAGRIGHATPAAGHRLAIDVGELQALRLADLVGDHAAAARLVTRWAESARRSPGVLELAIGPRAGSRLEADGSRLDATTLLVRFHEDVRPAGPDHAAETASIGALQQRLHRTLGDLEQANETLSERDLDVDQYATAVATTCAPRCTSAVGPGSSSRSPTRPRGPRAPADPSPPLPSGGPVRILRGPVPPPDDGR
jgi:hypothetical protein